MSASLIFTSIDMPMAELQANFYRGLCGLLDMTSTLNPVYESLVLECSIISRTILNPKMEYLRPAHESLKNHVKVLQYLAIFLEPDFVKKTINQKIDEKTTIKQLVEQLRHVVLPGIQTRPFYEQPALRFRRNSLDCIPIENRSTEWFLSDMEIYYTQRKQKIL